MSARKNSLIRYLVPAIAVLGAVIGWSSPSNAYIQQIVIDSTNTANYSPVPLGSSTPGAAVSYTIYTGRIFGVLNRGNPLNTGITDLNLASPVDGSYDYISQFSIVTPTNPAQRSGLLIYEVSNRGGSAITTSALVQGATYVQSGWQGDLLSQCSGAPGSLPTSAYPCVSLSSLYGTASGSYPFFTAPTGLTPFVIQVPVATTDGTAPNGTNTITGQVYSHIKAPLAANQTTAQLVIYSSPFTPFQPVSTDTNQATFWYDTAQSTAGVDTGKTVISSNQWSWAYCPSGPPGTPNPTWICLNSGTFNTNNLYEISYTAANPLVQGVGFAATRDLVSFLRYGTTAPGGGSNPIAGTASTTMIVGVSQSGAFVRGLTFYGFNEDEDGRIVFDGDWVIISGRILWMMPRWSQPNVLLDLYMGGNEAPVWWADFPNQARNLPAAGILDRCTASGTCPKVLETWGGNEFYINKMGADFTGFCSTCTSEIPQPANVYRYYVAGATHGGSGVGASTFNWTAPPTTPVSSSATYPTSPIPEAFTNNALQYAFIELLTNGTPMPASGSGISYPSFTQGQLAVATNQAAVGFPSNIPGLTYGGNQAWPPIIYNFGPNEDYTNQSGVPSISPPTISQVLAAYVPTVNSDGNENVGSIPTVLNQAPLGTYLSWNIIPSGPYVGQAVELNAGWWPFWDTAAHRTTAGDPRLSLEERYGTHAGYNCLVKQASYSAVAQRYLLSSDAATMMNLASSSNAVTGFSPTLADTSLANTLCMAPTHNYNADGLSDILWQDTSGNLALWEMNGSTVLNANTAGFGAVPAPWAIVGQRDFNGDGNADILWRNTTTGDIAIWEMNGTTILNANTAGLGNVPTAWSIVGTGDFNGDGMADILWRNTTTGDLAIWEMNGTTILNANTAGVGNVPLNWTVVGVGDFNGDGKADILWRNNNGNVAIWLMNGTTLTNANTATFGNMPASWSVAGTGDFNGDRMSDILWRDTSGNIAIWEMNGTTITNANTSGVGNLSTVWTVAETGDFDGNGKSDILWRDTSGDIAIWFMNGTTIASGAGLGTIPTTFTIQGTNAD